MIIDLCLALGAILEPQVPTVALDEEPMVWDIGKLYVFPVYPLSEVPFETSTARRQEFEVKAVRLFSNESEEAKQQRSEELAAALDELRGVWLAAIRTNQNNPVWGMISGKVDSTAPRMLDKRSAAVRVSGWRIVGG